MGKFLTIKVNPLQKGNSVEECKQEVTNVVCLIKKNGEKIYKEYPVPLKAPYSSKIDILLSKKGLIN